MMRSIIQTNIVLNLKFFDEFMMFFREVLHFTTILSYFSHLSMKIAYFNDFLLECYLYYVW